jgi:DNA-binding NarL/FixJ family response regulator
MPERSSLVFKLLTMEKKQTRLPQIFWIGRNDPYQQFLVHYFRSYDLEIFKILDPKEEFNLLEAEGADLIVAAVDDLGFGFDDCEVLEIISELFPDKKVIAMTESYNNEKMVKAISLGAKGYIFRNSQNERIVRCVQQVLLEDQTSYMVHTE